MYKFNKLSCPWFVVPEAEFFCRCVSFRLENNVEVTKCTYYLVQGQKYSCLFPIGKRCCKTNIYLSYYLYI